MRTSSDGTRRDSLRIDWVAPPFAGHLFPILALASGLAKRGFTRQRVICTPGARARIEACELACVPITSVHEAEIFAISNTPRRVGASPRRMLHQLRQNLALCTTMRDELTQIWKADRPALVIADLTMPFAGHLAQSLGARWWTTTPSPCALETRTGTPAYLGGWRDHGEWWSRLRDRAGNLVARQCKRAMALLVRDELARLGIPSIHRADGTEIAYSAERIFALGAREFELHRDDWPAALEFIGPLSASAPRPAASRTPVFEQGRVHVLVSLGTHLSWAKRDAVALSMRAANALPDWRFHVTLGRPELGEREPGVADYIGDGSGVPSNWSAFDYIPYDDRLAQYDIALTHAGTGVTYACLERGVPMVTWPQDYDQFDHAVRIEALGVGLRLRPDRAVASLLEAQDNPRYRAAARRMQSVLAGYEPIGALARQLDQVAAVRAADDRASAA